MGYIIVIEGTDGSGKRTQTTRLYERLLSEGYNVRMQSFPNYDSMSSGGVKMYLNGDFGDTDMSLDAYQASSLYAVDRLCTYNKDLKAFYENGGIIVSRETVVADFFEKLFHTAARTFFKGVAHEIHTDDKHTHTGKKPDEALEQLQNFT